MPFFGKRKTKPQQPPKVAANASAPSVNNKRAIEERRRDGISLAEKRERVSGFLEKMQSEIDRRVEDETRRAEIKGQRLLSEMGPVFTRKLEDLFKESGQEVKLTPGKHFIPSEASRVHPDLTVTVGLMPERDYSRSLNEIRSMVNKAGVNPRDPRAWDKNLIKKTADEMVARGEMQRSTYEELAERGFEGPKIAEFHSNRTLAQMSKYAPVQKVTVEPYPNVFGESSRGTLSVFVHEKTHEAQERIRNKLERNLNVNLQREVNSIRKKYDEEIQKVDMKIYKLRQKEVNPRKISKLIEKRNEIADKRDEEVNNFLRKKTKTKTLLTKEQRELQAKLAETYILPDVLKEIKDETKRVYLRSELNDLFEEKENSERLQDIKAIGLLSAAGVIPKKEVAKLVTTQGVEDFEKNFKEIKDRYWEDIYHLKLKKKGFIQNLLET